MGNTGIEWRTSSWLRLLINVDRSFRAPNLDDLTSRQQTGPGFQFENPALAPETATTYEAGVRVVAPFVAELWLFRTLIDDAVVKSPRRESDCPPSTPQCQAAWTWGEGPNVGDPPSDPSMPFDDRVPLSRVPPLNGTAEFMWRHS